MNPLLLLTVLGCSTQAPLPLPEPEEPQWHAKGRMVSAADLRGYLVMPQTLPAVGALVLVDRIEDAERAQAHAMAEQGEVVLLLPPAVEQERGSTYLDKLSSTRGIRTLCQREVCP